MSGPSLVGVMVGTADPDRLVAYYTDLFGKPWFEDGGYVGWQLGVGGLVIGAHSEVSGTNAQPGRIMWNLETPDVQGEFARLKAAGAIVVQEPYQPGPADYEGPPMWVATFADPDGNYFQLMSPMPAP